jgi:NAD(P)-dependent dehydrogenase (short-subunit alcohol dehydrogenase family)
VCNLFAEQVVRGVLSMHSVLDLHAPKQWENALGNLLCRHPTGRPATADEIAEAIVFLATDRSSFIYGAKLAVDDGRIAI